MRASAVPIDEAVSGVRRFILRGLNIAQKERNHEQGGREDEKEFEGRDVASSGGHGYFVAQSTSPCQARISGNRQIEAREGWAAQKIREPGAAAFFSG